MSEQNVEVNIKVNSDADAAQRSLKDAGKTVEQLAEEEKKYQKILSGTYDGLVMRKRLYDDLEKMQYGSKEAAQEAKYQEALRGTISLQETQKRLKADLAKHAYEQGGAWGSIKEAGSRAMHGDLAGAAQAIGGFTAALGTAITATIGAAAAIKSLSDASMNAGLARGMAPEDWQSEIAGVHIGTARTLGAERAQSGYGRFWAGLHDMGDSWGGLVHGLSLGTTGSEGEHMQETRRAENEMHAVKHAQIAARQNEQVARTVAARDSALNNLSFRQVASISGMTAESARSVGAAGAQVGSMRGLSVSLAGSGMLAGVGREAEEEDLRRRSGYGLSLRMQGLSSTADLSASGAQVAEAQRQRDAAKSTYDEHKADNDANRRAIERLPDGWVRDAASASMSGSDAALAEKKKVLDEATTRLLGVQEQYTQKMVGNRQKELDILTQQYVTESGIAQAEKSRVKGIKESYGGMKPIDRMATLNLARKLDKGEDLTHAEWEFAQSHRQFLGDKVGKMENKFAEQSGFGELSRLGGLNARAEQAEKVAVEIQNRITIDVNTNATELSNELIPKLLGIFGNVAAGIIGNFNDQRNRDRNEQAQQNRRAVTG